MEILDAGLLMEELFKKGTYQNWKSLDNKIQLIKSELLERFSKLDFKVKLFEEQKVVIRNIVYHTYKTDKVKLNEYLNDLGILVKVAKFECDGLVGFEKPTEYYTKFNIGKLGRTPKENYDFSNLSDEELIQLWNETNSNQNQLAAEIDFVKDQMLIDPLLNSSKNIKCSYGSVSLVAKKSKHYNEEILNSLGIEFFIENAVVDSEELNECIMAGFITQEEIKQFQEIVDVSSRFVVQTIESYQKQSWLLDSQRSKQAKNLQELWSN